jgi:hypothetical protein
MASDREYMRSIQTTAPASIEVNPADVDGTLDWRLDDDDRDRDFAPVLELTGSGNHKGADPVTPRRE